MKSLLCALVCTAGMSGLVVQSQAMAQPAAEEEISFLSIGDQAPPLHISTWLKGDPVEEFQSGQIYVVEFWATWCGPCIAGMPHVSEIQEHYKDDVTVIGVNIWERDTDAVPGWMEERGDKLMHYTVAMEQDTMMADAWMKPAGENGIPSAFIVNGDGVIAWIGHPGSMDEPLEQIVAGDWDVRAAAKARNDEKAEEIRAQREQERFMARAEPAIEKMQTAETPEERMDAVRTLLDLKPPANIASNLLMTGASTYASEMEDPEGACKFIADHHEMIWDNPMALNMYSWMILTDENFEAHRDTDLAMKLAMRAHELTDEKDSMVIDTVARAYMLKAIDMQKSAVENADGSMRSDLEKTLEAFEEAYKAGL